MKVRKLVSTYTSLKLYLGKEGRTNRNTLIEEHWDEDKYRMENRIDNAEQDVADFPDDAARWTGRKVGEVEDIPQDIENDYDRAKWGVENKFDNAVDDVEDI